MSLWEKSKGESDEWYTRKEVFDALGCRFDMDVAPARYGTAEGAYLWIALQEAARRKAYDEKVAAAIEGGEKPPPPFVPRVVPQGLTGSNFVPADYLLDGNGLLLEWVGFIWMNAPFGGRNGLEPWLKKFFKHGNGLALTPDRTSAPWFQWAFQRADAVLFTRKLRFIRPDGTEGVSPSTGTALFASGQKGVEALERAKSVGFGVLALPAKAA